MVVPRRRADYPRVTHPCAALLRAEAPFSLDLHVLSLPLTFALSQDQTLQFNPVAISLSPRGVGRGQRVLSEPSACFPAIQFSKTLGPRPPALFFLPGPRQRGICILTKSAFASTLF